MTPWRSANGRSRSVDSVAIRPRSTSSRCSWRPPLSIRARSRSSATIWAMLPVSTSSLPIRSRIFAGTGAPAAWAPSASRAERSRRAGRSVVIGVRSSCDRLSMNSARMRWRRRSSATSSRTSQTPRIGDRRARTTRVVPVVPGHVGERHLAARPARLARAARDRLDPVVAEGLDRGPPEHRARLAPQEDVRGGVGDLDAQLVAQPDDARRRRGPRGSRGRAAAARARTRRPRRAGGAVAAGPRGRRRPATCRRRRRPRASASRSASSIVLDRPPARQGDRERDRERDGLDGDEGDDDAVHGGEDRTVGRVLAGATLGP